MTYRSSIFIILVPLGTRENMVSVSGISIPTPLDSCGHRKWTQEELTRVEADARDEERLKVGKAEDDARRSRCSRCSVRVVPLPINPS